MYLPFFRFCPFYLCSVFQLLLHSDLSFDIFFVYLSKDIFHPYIIHPDNWTFVAWNQRVFGHALLHHHLESRCHIFPDMSHSIFSNNSSFFAILMQGLLISNEFIFFRWRSYTFFLPNFRKPVCILNMCKIQKTFYLPSEDRMRIVFLVNTAHKTLSHRLSFNI